VRCQMSFREGRPCPHEAQCLVSDTVVPPHACCGECRRAWEALFAGTERVVTAHPGADAPVIIHATRPAAGRVVSRERGTGA
jgi:hypothetical protein